VLGGVRDLGQLRECVRDRLRAPAELGEHRCDRVLVVDGGRQDRACAEIADAVGHRLEPRAVLAGPVGAEHVVHELARIGREEGRVARPLDEPSGRQLGEQRLGLGDPNERWRAGER